ncbi:hypothetical protein [Legionella gresilensis]|uniref:hypothetical protein n=1 Tax=Legionella gresilensis TaxID=91823 RepID=UPI00104142E1|nr:hypothetical protein [Legionella gresilensis]
MDDDLDVENATKLFNMEQKIVDYVGNNEAPLELRIKLYDFAEEYKFSDRCLSNPHDLKLSSEADNEEEKGHHNNPL